MFSTADRFVFLEWLKAFVLVLGSLFGLLLLFEIQDSFTDLLEYDARVGQIAFYYGIIAPSFLTVVLPASILISILYALGQLHRNNEFVALRSAGMSVFRVTRTIWAAAAIASGVLWYLNSSLIPWSFEESVRLKESLRFKKQAEVVEVDKVGIIKNLAFDNRKTSRMWFINRYSRYTFQAYGVTVTVMDEQRRVVRRIVARHGYYDDVEGGWHFFEGRDMQYDPDAELRARQREAESFDDLDLDADDGTRAPPFEKLYVAEFDDDPELMALFGKKPSSLSFLQLKRITDNFTQEDNPSVLGYEARLHSLMASAAGCLIVAGIAIPFAVAGVRTNPAVAISKSIGLFFGFYILTSVLGALGRNGALSPEVAAWTPMGLMILIAYVLMRRVR